MTWDNDTIRTAISVASFIGALAAALYSFWTARNKTVRADLTAIEKNVGELERRVHGVESELRHTLTNTHLQSFYEQLGDLRGDLRGLSSKLEGINRVVDLINSDMIDRAGRAREDR